MILNVEKRSVSLAIIVLKEIATSLNVDDGDILFATKTPSPYSILVLQKSSKLLGEG
jgi:hypothetical protein